MAFEPIIAVSLVTGALIANPPVPIGAFRYGQIVGEGNTLQSVIAAAADPAVYEPRDEQTLVSWINFSLLGQLTLRPGETIRLASADFGKRMCYILGRCDWEGATIDGATWVDVGQGSSGVWKDVTIRAGDTRGYPVLYFRTSDLRWDGGLVDCFPHEGPPAPFCLAMRAGYYPDAFANTIRNVTFRCASNFILDQTKQRMDIDLTFEDCVIETTGEHRANIISSVNVSDGCSTTLTFKDCIRRRDGVDAPASAMLAAGELMLSGSGCTVRFIEGGAVTEVRHEGLSQASETPGTFLPELSAAVQELTARACELSTDERLRGTLCYARARCDDLAAMRDSIRQVGWYAPSDVAAVEAVVAEVRDTLGKAPLTVVEGSVYCPARASLSPPPPGVVAIEEIGEGKLRVRTPASEWVYFSNPGGDKHATFLPESTVHGKPILAGAYPDAGGPSVRYVHPNASGQMLWELSWTPKITKTGGRIGAFETELMTGEALGVRATWVFFADFPEIVLCNARSLQLAPTGGAYTATSARWQAYATPALGTYNGVRLWSSDPAGVRVDYAPIREHLDAVEPKYGFFFGENPAWYYTTVSRGTILAQWNGYNDWTFSPPCGFMIRASDYQGAWTSLGGYYGQIIQVYRPLARDADDLNHQMLWFEGAGLKCWENIEAIQAAFDHPCEPLLDLAGHTPGALYLWERDGIRRLVEIVCLPRPYEALESDREWYRGDICMTLLRDVADRSKTLVGTLPVTLEADENGFTVTNGAQMLRDLWVRLPVQEAAGITVNGAAPAQVAQGPGWVAVKCDLLPGANTFEIVR